jgi:hypothetical protein
MFIMRTEETEWSEVTGHARSGRVSRKFVREGEVSPGVGYTSDLIKYHAGEDRMHTPRHRHNFDQLRLTLRGAPDYGNEQIAADGAVVFFPAGAYYGPQTMDDSEIMLIQWSPEWVTRAQSTAAYEALAGRGEFRGGYYFESAADGAETKRDGTNAIWEEATGKPLEYPDPRYSQPVLINPGGFQWRPLGAGSRVRDLGHFTEDDVHVTALSWDEGGSVPLTPERTQMVWIGSGSVKVGEDVLPERTVFFSDFGETHELVGVEAGEATSLGFPLPPAESA